MSDVLKTIVKYAGYGFAALVIAFTAWQSYSLVFGVTNNQIESVLALILFDLGALYWFLVALKEAEGKLQMALAFTMFAFSLSLVILTVALELGAVAADLLGQRTPMILIAITAAVNLVAKYLFPLISLDNLREIKKRARAAKLEDLVDKKVDSKMDAISDVLAEEKANAMLENERHEIRMTITRPEQRTQPAQLTTGKHDFVDVSPLAEPSPNGTGPGAKH